MELFFYRQIGGIGPWTGEPGPHGQLIGSQNSESLSAVKFKMSD
jgi:hypothetical protein